MFPLRLPEGLRARADARARELGLSLNALVAVALDQYLTAVHDMSHAIAGDMSRAVAPVTGRRAKGGGRAARVSSGDMPRNAPCYCGSGKKFKRCHGA